MEGIDTFESALAAIDDPQSDSRESLANSAIKELWRIQRTQDLLKEVLSFGAADNQAHNELNSGKDLKFSAFDKDEMSAELTKLRTNKLVREEELSGVIGETKQFARLKTVVFRQFGGLKQLDLEPYFDLETLTLEDLCDIEGIDTGSFGPWSSVTAAVFGIWAELFGFQNWRLSKSEIVFRSRVWMAWATLLRFVTSALILARICSQFRV